MESRNGIHIVNYAEQIGIDTQQYQLVTID